MNLIKYDRAKEGTNVAVIVGSNNSSNTTIIAGSRGENRDIWGQLDSGDDVNGSMVINGNISINAIEEKNYDPDDDDDDGEIIEEETGGGNLNVEYKITSDEAEANEIYAKNHLYINYPHNGSKQCVIDIISTIQTDITTIKSDITTIKNDIIELKQHQCNCEGCVTEARVKELIEEALKNYKPTNPIDPDPPTPDDPDPVKDEYVIKVKVDNDIYSLSRLRGMYLFKYGSLGSGLIDSYVDCPYEAMAVDFDSGDETIYIQPIMANCKLTVNVISGETIQLEQNDKFEVLALQDDGNYYIVGQGELQPKTDYEFYYTIR